MIVMREQTLIGEVVDRLTRKYPTVAASIVVSLVHEAHSRFDGRPLREYVPLLVERRARAELAKLSAEADVSLVAAI
jgi:hypothetical protein